MSVVLAGLLVVGAGGLWIYRRALERRQAAEEPASRAPAPREPSPEPLSDELPGFACQLGDVVLRRGGDEAWLAGGLLFAEEKPVAVLFVSPGEGGGVAVYATPEPRASLFWLRALDAAALLVQGEPPTALEHGDVRFERVRRLPVRSTRLGLGAPDVGSPVLVAEYAAAGGERLVLLRGARGSVAFAGAELAEASYEVVPSGRRTLDDA